MGKTKRHHLKIGDLLYHYVSMKGVFRYEVIGKRETKDSIFYEVECMECSHGYKCQVLVSQNLDVKQVRFRYLEMLNEREGDEQYYWHNTGDYFLTKQEPTIEAIKQHVEKYESEIKSMVSSLGKKKKRLEELKLLLGTFSEELKNDK